MIITTMHLNSGAFAIALATMIPVYGSCLAPPPPDTPIPEQWKDSLPLAWDNGLIRFQRENPDYSLATYKNFAFDQIMDGNGYSFYSGVSIHYIGSMLILSVWDLGLSMSAFDGAPTRL